MTSAWSRLDRRPWSRVYCWRVGAAITLTESDKGRCPECGDHDHAAVARGICGDFAPCGSHGHYCTLPPGHDGGHQTNGCKDHSQAGTTAKERRRPVSSTASTLATWDRRKDVGDSAAVTPEATTRERRRLALSVYQLDPAVVFTCDRCKDVAVCASAFDPYNTDGDCLDLALR